MAKRFKICKHCKAKLIRKPYWTLAQVMTGIAQAKPVGYTWVHTYEDLQRCKSQAKQMTKFERG